MKHLSREASVGDLVLSAREEMSLDRWRMGRMLVPEDAVEGYHILQQVEEWPNVADKLIQPRIWPHVLTITGIDPAAWVPAVLRSRDYQMREWEKGGDLPPWLSACEETPWLHHVLALALEREVAERTPVVRGVDRQSFLLYERRRWVASVGEEKLAAGWDGFTAMTVHQFPITPWWKVPAYVRRLALRELICPSAFTEGGEE